MHLAVVSAGPEEELVVVIDCLNRLYIFVQVRVVQIPYVIYPQPVFMSLFSSSVLLQKPLEYHMQ